MQLLESLASSNNTEVRISHTVAQPSCLMHACMHNSISALVPQKTINSKLRSSITITALIRCLKYIIKGTLKAVVSTMYQFSCYQLQEVACELMADLKALKQQC